MDPPRFQKEYSRWTEYACDHGWWEYVENQFKAAVDPVGVEVVTIQFDVSYSQGSYAAFEGSILLHLWMDNNGDGTQTYAEKYPALRLAAEDYGEYARVGIYRRCRSKVSLDGYCSGNSYPSGIFKQLDQETWDELVYDQLLDAGLEQAMQDYVDDLCDTLFCDLREEYEHLTSEEAFIVSCECSEITFELEEATS